MVSVFDVAEYILSKTGPTTAMKLQKLVFYSQAWALVWDDEPMFGAKIEAWANGPVVPDLFYEHKGKYHVAPGDFPGNPDRLPPVSKETVDAVLATYAIKSSHWLSELTHSEDPWKNARVGLGSGERGNREITLASMAEYYSSL